MAQPIARPGTALQNFASGQVHSVLQPLLEEMFVAQPDDPVSFIVGYLTGESKEGAKKMNELMTQLDKAEQLIIELERQVPLQPADPPTLVPTAPVPAPAVDSVALRLTRHGFQLQLGQPIVDVCDCPLTDVASGYRREVGSDAEHQRQHDLPTQYAHLCCRHHTVHRFATARCHPPCW